MLRGWEEASEDKTPTHFFTKNLFPPFRASVSPRGKDAVNLDQGTGGPVRNSGAVESGRNWPDFAALAPQEGAPSPSPGSAGHWSGQVWGSGKEN